MRTYIRKITKISVMFENALKKRNILKKKKEKFAIKR